MAKRLRSQVTQENDKPVYQRLKNAGEKRQVVYLMSKQESMEKWRIGVVVPYDELDNSMNKKPKGKQVVIKSFEDHR
jgi:hypothetical protein